MLAAGTSDGDVLLWDTRRADKGAMGRLEQARAPAPSLFLSSFLSPPPLRAPLTFFLSLPGDP